MTIIAGFLCKQGILFATDTKHTFTGWMQLEAGKMFASVYPNGGKTLFALSGDVHYARMIIQHCERELVDLPTDQFTLDNCRTTIERVLCEDYAHHIFPHPEPRPHVEFLIGVYSPVSKKAGLFSTEGTSVNRLPDYDCRGTGAYLCHFLLRDKVSEIERDREFFESPDFDVMAIGANVLTAIKRIKGYDDNCGRSTDLAWLGHDGRLSYITRLYEDPVDAADYNFTMTRLVTGEIREDLLSAPPKPRPPDAKGQRVRKFPKRGQKVRRPSRG